MGAPSPRVCLAGKKPSSHYWQLRSLASSKELAALTLQVAHRPHVIWGASAEGRGRVAAARAAAAAAAAAVAPVAAAVRRADTCVRALPSVAFAGYPLHIGQSGSCTGYAGIEVDFDKRRRAKERSPMQVTCTVAGAGGALNGVLTNYIAEHGTRSSSYQTRRPPSQAVRCPETVCSKFTALSRPEDGVDGVRQHVHLRCFVGRTPYCERHCAHVCDLDISEAPIGGSYGAWSSSTHFSTSYFLGPPAKRRTS
jgi:hypothetical protein